jgi:hypothetical protein
MVAAVIFSGGEVDLIRSKFEVHSLGDGLKKLREAFAPSGTRKALLTTEAPPLIDTLGS